MNQVNQINLDRQQFAIARDAEKNLQDYIQAIARAVENDEETVREIEVRIAELLLGRGAGKDQVVVRADIDYVRHQLGEPAEFSDGEDQAEQLAIGHEKSKAAGKRLYRDTDTALIAGVSSGLAAYSGVHVWIIRIIFILLAFGRGSGIVLYALLWIFIPPIKSAVDRLEMSGQPVTAQNLRSLIDRADLGAASRRTSRSIGKLIERIARFCINLFGIGLSVAGAVAVMVIVTLITYLLPNGIRASNSRLFPVTVPDYALLIVASIGGLIVALLLIIAGITVVRKRQIVPNWLQITAASLILVSTGAGIALGFAAVPAAQDRLHALHHKVNRSVPAFEALELSGRMANYGLQNADHYAVEISYTGNYPADEVTSKLENGVLKLDAGALSNKQSCSSFCLYDDPNVFVTVYAPSFKAVRLNGEMVTLSANRLGFGSAQTLDITADRRSDIYISNTGADAVAVSVDSRTGSRSITLTNPRPLMDGAGVSFGGRYDTDTPVDVYGIGRLNLMTDQACDSSRPLVTVLNVPEVSVNDTALTSDQLRQNYAAYTEGVSDNADQSQKRVEQCVIQYQQ